MITIISPRQRIETNNYGLFYARVNEPGSGYSFDCDCLGNIVPKDLAAYMAVEAQLQDHNRFKTPFVQIFHNSYIQPAIARCECGREIMLDDPLDNVCFWCHRIYNSSGQEVNCLARDADEPYED